MQSSVISLTIWSTLFPAWCRSASISRGSRSTSISSHSMSKWPLQHAPH